jgi:hypothetical protein
MYPIDLLEKLEENRKLEAYTVLWSHGFCFVFPPDRYRVVGVFVQTVSASRTIVQWGPATSNFLEPQYWFQPSTGDRFIDNIEDLPPDLAARFI